jgi:hypothetical protein
MTRALGDVARRVMYEYEVVRVLNLCQPADQPADVAVTAAAHRGIYR